MISDDLVDGKVEVSDDVADFYLTVVHSLKDQFRIGKDSDLTISGIFRRRAFISASVVERDGNNRIGMILAVFTQFALVRHSDVLRGYRDRSLGLRLRTERQHTYRRSS